jgi:methylglyoxal synthase
MKNKNKILIGVLSNNVNNYNDRFHFIVNNIDYVNESYEKTCSLFNYSNFEYNVFLSYLIIHNYLKIILMPKNYLFNDEFLSLIRLANIYDVIIKSDIDSILNHCYFNKTCLYLKNIPMIEIPLNIVSSDKNGILKTIEQNNIFHLNYNKYNKHNIAFVAHNNKKDELVNFVTQYHDIIDVYYDRILATHGTGKRLLACDQLANLHNKIVLVNDGQLGGDIEIAFEILSGNVDAIVFFIDHSVSHPHSVNINTLLKSAYYKNIPFLSSEYTATEYFNLLECKYYKLTNY